MRWIIFIFLFCIIKTAHAEHLSKDDYAAAQSIGYSKQDMKESFHQKVKSINHQAIIETTLLRLEKSESERAALFDETLDEILYKADIVLRHLHKDKLADDIQLEYNLFYRNAFSLPRTNEMGDHPPISKWIDQTHAKIHDAIGDFWCKQTHIHDVKIMNHANVVIHPKMAKDLKDYKDHFAGHLIWGFFWEHHGVAGVIAYHAVSSACSVATSGMGLVFLVCGPVATYAENGVDQYLAPSIAERIWDRAHQN